jgi:hypothetical protein
MTQRASQVSSRLLLFSNGLNRKEEDKGTKETKEKKKREEE